MNTFSAIFGHESRRFLCKRNLIVFLLFILLSLYFIRDGIVQYNNVIENKDRFQEIESVKVEHYINYTQYGLFGFRLLFIPSPLSILFTNSSLVTGLIANVDSASVLKIYNSFKGKNLYADKAGGFKDFSGIIFLFGTLFVLYLGYDSFRHQKYLKFLFSFSGHGRVFVFILLSRILLLIGFFGIVLGLALLMIVSNGISLSGAEISNILSFLSVLIIMVTFLFLFGAIAGTLRSRFNGIVMVMVIWFSSVFLIPGAVHNLVAKRADDITSNYHLEFEKLKLVMAFEKKAFDEAKRYTNMDERIKSERKLVESYWNNEFQKIQALEIKMHREMMENFHYFRYLSNLFPTTYYLSVGNEISSRGYESFFQFLSAYS